MEILSLARRNRSRKYLTRIDYERNCFRRLDSIWKIYLLIGIDHEEYLLCKRKSGMQIHVLAMFDRTLSWEYLIFQPEINREDHAVGDRLETGISQKIHFLSNWPKVWRYLPLRTGIGYEDTCPCGPELVMKILPLRTGIGHEDVCPCGPKLIVTILVFADRSR